MSTSPPKVNDIRVCVVSGALPEHALAQTVSDIITAKAVHDALIALLAMQLDHHIHNQPYSVEAQVFTEDSGWTEIFDLTKEI